MRYTVPIRLSLLCAGFLSSSPVLAAPRLVHSNAAGTELEFRAAEPIIRAGVDGAEVLIDGYLPMGDAPGAPDLPGTRVLVAVPAGSRVRHRVVTSGVTTLRGVRPRPVATPVRPGSDGLVEMAYREDPALYAGPHPAGHVQVSGVMRVRDLDVVAVAVRPVIFDPELGGLRAAGRIRVILETAGGSVARAVDATRVPAADLRLYQATVVNPAAASIFHRPARPARRRALGGAPAGPPGAGSRAGGRGGFASAATWVKLYVGARGLTRVTGAELSQAGVPIDAVDPSTIRVFWGGGLDPDPEVSARSPSSPAFMTECAIRVADGGAAGRLDAGDSILFLAQGAGGWLDDFAGAGYDLEHHENLLVEEGVFWLAWGTGFDGAARRLESVAAAPAEGAPAITAGRVRQHSEQDRRYEPDLFPFDSAMSGNGRDDGVSWEKWWFSTTLFDRDPPLTIPIETPAAVPSVRGRVRVRLWGNTAFGRGPIHDHYVLATWNGEPILTPAGQDTFIWDGPRSPSTGDSGRQDIESDQLIFAASNTLGLDSIVIDTPGRERADESLIAFFQVDYTRTLDLAGETSLEFASPPDLEGTVNFEISNAPAAAAVFEVTDPYAPTAIGGERAGDTIRFAAAFGAGEVRKYWVGPPSAYRAVVRIELDASLPDLRSTDHAARYLVIAHDSLIEAAGRLAAAHVTLPGETAPARGMAVRVSDVYDEFGWGLKSPIAIRNFVDYAVHAWQVDGRPLYVCLLGDASYDPLDHLGSGSTLTDPIPAPNFWNWIGGSFGGSEYLSDDWYARTFGDSLDTAPDRLTDVFIGRLPAGTAEEARVMVDEKAIPFLGGPEIGPWRQRVLLSADDELANERQEGFIHVTNSEFISAVTPAELERVKIYLHDYPRDELGVKPEARRAFIEAFNDGAAIVNYIGHGAPDILAHEALFRVENVGQLENGARLPLFFTFSCTVNRFDEPRSEGIGEALVKHRGGGAITSTGATDLAFIGSNQRLNEATFSNLFVDGDFTRPRSIGEALAMAKNPEAANGGTAEHNARKYNLIGDPALLPPTPRYLVELAATEDGAGAGLDTLRTGIPYSLTGSVVGGRGGPGLAVAGDATVQVRDSEAIHHRGTSFPGFPVSGRDVFRSTLPFQDGTLAARFVVPIDASQSMTGARGLAELRVYASGTFGDALGARRVYLDALHPGPGETEGPTIQAFFDAPGNTVLPDATLHIRVSDPSGINIVGNTPFNSLFMRIDEEITVVMNEQFGYVPGSATAGVIDYRLPALAAGAHVARIFASDNFLNRSQHDLAFTVVAPGELEIRRAALYPNPFRPQDRPGTTLGFEIRESAEVAVRVLTVSGRLVRERFDELGAALGPGFHQVRWDGRDEDGDFVANGVYLVKISARSVPGGRETATILRSVVSR